MAARHYTTKSHSSKNGKETKKLSAKVRNLLKLVHIVDEKQVA